MKYENYKRFFKGGFYPVDSVHSLVNIEDTGEFSVRTIVGPNQVKLEVYPDDLTCHTAIEYFATKATYSDGSKPILQILNGPNAQNVYNWAQQYADKFDSIEIV